MLSQKMGIPNLSFIILKKKNKNRPGNLNMKDRMSQNRINHMCQPIKSISSIKIG